jgi:hypothetical protein
MKIKNKPANEPKPAPNNNNNKNSNKQLNIDMIIFYYYLSIKYNFMINNGERDWDGLGEYLPNYVCIDKFNDTIKLYNIIDLAYVLRRFTH